MMLTSSESDSGSQAADSAEITENEGNDGPSTDSEPPGASGGDSEEKTHEKVSREQRGVGT